MKNYYVCTCNIDRNMHEHYAILISDTKLNIYDPTVIAKHKTQESSDLAYNQNPHPIFQAENRTKFRGSDAFTTIVSIC